MGKRLSSSERRHASGRSSVSPKFDEAKEKSVKELAAERLLDRQIDIPLYVLLALLVSHALSGNSSLSLPHLSAHLPHTLQALLPAWSRQLPSLAPFATELPNASHNSKESSRLLSTGSMGPFRSDALGFGHPLSALHNFTRACLRLSYLTSEAVQEPSMHPHHYPHHHHIAHLAYHDGTHTSWNPRWIEALHSHGTAGRGSEESFSSFLTKKYAKGPKDIFVIATGIFLFTILRAAVIKYVLIPMAATLIKREDTKQNNLDSLGRRLARKERRRKIARFSEQAWMALYCFTNFCFGLYVARSEPYWNNPDAIWDRWPYEELTGLTKFYYLTQISFWFQQILVLNVEERRKDHWQMFCHHIVTICLLLGSYCSHFTPIGNVVLLLMDPSDVFLSTAKCLKYMDLRQTCDVAFGAFMLSWIITRHVLYVMMLYSCIFRLPNLMPLQPGQDGSEWLGYRSPMTLILIGLLCVLQLIICIWFVMIAKVAYKVIAGQEAEDSRSDVESDDEDVQLQHEAEERKLVSEGRNPPSKNTPSMSNKDFSIKHECESGHASSNQGERKSLRKNQR